MNKELTQRLYQDFPQLYRGHSKPAEVSSMCWGFQCDDGWYQLIHELSHQLTDYANTHPAANIEATQVKEKFGALRFHLLEHDEETSKMIKSACERSLKICELSGNAGVLCIKNNDESEQKRPRFKVLSEKMATENGYVPYAGA